MNKHHRTREEVAKAEAGTTDFAPGVKFPLCLFFLLFICLPPLVTVVAHRGKPLPAFLELVPPAREAAAVYHSATGAWAGAMAVNRNLMDRISVLEKELGNTSVFKAWSVPWTRWLLARFLRAGNEDCYIGANGRLYYRADVDFVTGPGFLPEPGRRAGAAGGRNRDPISAILDFRGQLASRDIDLIVFPVPLKTTVDGPACDNPSMPEFLDRLRGEGIRVFYPLADLSELRRASGADSFLRGDTHWTPEAMHLVAERLAAFLGPDAGRSDSVLAAPGVTFRATGKTVKNFGDLADMLTLPRDRHIIPSQTVAIEAITAPDGSPWKPDAGAEVLFLGDSFANIFSDPRLGWGEGAGLVEHLSHALGRPLDSILKNAGGSAATRQELAQEIKSGNDRLRGKRFVVWSFAARDLMRGEWPLLDVSPSTAAGRRADEVWPGGAARVRILEVSSPPDVEGPYPDALGVVGAERLDSSGGVIGTVLLQGWVMRDREILPFAALRPGQTLDLNLVPWERKSAEEPDLSSVQVVNDIDDYESPMYWVEEPQ